MKHVDAELARLQGIAAAFYAGKLARNAAREAVIDLIAGWLKCSRVSLWRFDGDAGALALLCFASKAVGGALDTVERRLEQGEYHAYFDGLAQRGTYVCHDTLNDPNLQPMREAYLLPHGVLSLLDAAFMVNGRAFGMVCCEQTDAKRRWRPSEVTGLRAIVGKLALLMAAGRDEILWASPSLPLAPLPLSA